MKKYLGILAVLMVSILIGMAAAQQNHEPATETTGSFLVSAGADHTVLVDSKTGRSWRLHHSQLDSRSVWLPINRIDDEEGAEKWIQMQRMKLEELREQQRKSRSIEQPSNN